MSNFAARRGKIGKTNVESLFSEQKSRFLTRFWDSGEFSGGVGRFRRVSGGSGRFFRWFSGGFFLDSFFLDQKEKSKKSWSGSGQELKSNFLLKLKQDFNPTKFTRGYLLLYFSSSGPSPTTVFLKLPFSNFRF